MFIYYNILYYVLSCKSNLYKIQISRSRIGQVGRWSMSQESCKRVRVIDELLYNFSRFDSKKYKIEIAVFMFEDRREAFARS